MKTNKPAIKLTLSKATVKNLVVSTGVRAGVTGIPKSQASICVRSYNIDCMQ